MTTYYSKIANLELEITGVELDPLQMPGGWTRHSTVVRLVGPDGTVGRGEDVSYEAEDQLGFQGRAAQFELAGRFTFDEFSQLLDRQPLFDSPPVRETNHLYRRWAFESAGLDLALRQANTNLGELLGLEPQALRFVVSMGLGDPPSVDGLARVRCRFPDMCFKVDLSGGWTREFVAALAEFGNIDTVDLKGHYHGSFQGPPANADQYRWVAEMLPRAWIEDAAWSGDAWEVLQPHQDRLTWDAVIHSLADLMQLPHVPKCVNIKPSRFGFVAELMRTYEYCRNQGIAMYGGGQFELGVGRRQIQELASLFHPDGSNDVAPSGFNEGTLGPDLSGSPLAVPERGPGLG